MVSDLRYGAAAIGGALAGLGVTVLVLWLLAVTTTLFTSPVVAVLTGLGGGAAGAMAGYAIGAGLAIRRGW